MTLINPIQSVSAFPYLEDIEEIWVQVVFITNNHFPACEICDLQRLLEVEQGENIDALWHGIRYQGGISGQSVPVLNQDLPQVIVYHNPRLDSSR